MASLWHMSYDLMSKTCPRNFVFSSKIFNFHSEFYCVLYCCCRYCYMRRQMGLFSNALNNLIVSENQLVRLAHYVNKYSWVFYTRLSGLDIEHFQTKTINNLLIRIVCVFRDKDRIKPRRVIVLLRVATNIEHVIHSFVIANRWRVFQLNCCDTVSLLSCAQGYF